MTEVIVKSKNGLHARPASMIIDLASKYAGDVAFHKDGKKYNGKSIMSVMSMGLRENEMVMIEATGDDSVEFELKLKEIIDSITE